MAMQALESGNRGVGRDLGPHAELAQPLKAFILGLGAEDILGAQGDSERELDAREYELGRELAAARDLFDEVVARIRRLPGMGAFLRDVTLDDILAAPRPGEPLCYLAATSHGSACLIVRHEADPGERLEAAWCPLTRDEAIAAASGARAAADASGRGLREVVATVGSRLMGPVAVALGDASGMVLVACGVLAQLPLHAATLPDTGKPLLSRYVVSYAPSLRLLLAARRRAQAEPRAPVLVTASQGPRDDGAADDLLAHQDVAAVARLFDAVGESRQVTGDLLGALPHATHVHLACHGDYRPGDPLASGLDLPGGRITLADLLDTQPRPLEHARLVMLSACETGATDATLPDEEVGLAAGILLAGGAGVACTLWEARDTAAVVLMVPFYRRLLGTGTDPGTATPGEPARALREAQLWLRDVTLPDLLAENWLPPGIRQRLMSDGVPERPFSHPYLWAPFILVGT
jgi:hypothetical protein